PTTSAASQLEDQVGEPIDPEDVRWPAGGGNANTSLSPCDRTGTKWISGPIAARLDFMSDSSARPGLPAGDRFTSARIRIGTILKTKASGTLDQSPLRPQAEL